MKLYSLLSAQKSRLFRFLTMIVTISFTYFSLSCKSYSVDRQVFAPEVVKYMTIDADTPIKAHLKTGELWVFRSATFNDSLGAVFGEVQKYDVKRSSGTQSSTVIDTLKYSRVALFETNRLQTSGQALSMSVITGVIVGIAVLCIGISLATHAKICYGSCPTYYAQDGSDWKLQGEGFSSAILPALEERDIDALTTVRPHDRDFVLRVKNEALETHVIRSCNILAVAKGEGEQVVHCTNDSFVVGTHRQSPLHCTAPEGDVTQLLAHFDDTERYSQSDSTDMTRKEVIDCEFVNPSHSDAALVVGFRQTLMTTYLFYQTLAYMGNNAGRILSHVEADKHPELITSKLFDALGGIDIEVFDGTTWLPAGRYFEIGPIATNQQALRLPRVHTPTLKVRLRMTKGYWRLNSTELIDVVRPAHALRLQPTAVMFKGERDTVALHSLLDNQRTLCTVAGDVYDVHYMLPETIDSYDYFIESQGYYLEWIRKDWMGHESPQKIAQLMSAPLDYIRSETVPFKLVESSLESTFWNSRYEQVP